MKLLADKNWNVALCGAQWWRSVNILPAIQIAPKSMDALGTRISISFLFWHLWLDVAWMKWRKVKPHDH